MAKLTAKQKRFVDEYLIDLNATQAYIRAGYKNYDSAGVEAAKTLKNPKIEQSIAEAMAKRSKRTGINQDRVIEELAKIAFVNINNVVDTDDGSVLPNAADEDLACIESIKVKEFPTKDGGTGVEREIKIASKMKALELLGKHLGMWNDKLNLNLNLPVFMEGEDELEE